MTLSEEEDDSREEEGGTQKTLTRTVPLNLHTSVYPRTISVLKSSESVTSSEELFWRIFDHRL